MPTIDQLREAFPHLAVVSDETLTSPFLHLGVISSYLPEQERLQLSLEVIGEALRDAPAKAVAWERHGRVLNGIREGLGLS